VGIFDMPQRHIYYGRP